MKKKNRIINIAITLSIIIILSLNGKVYAENEIENTNTNTGVNTTTNTEADTKKENTTSQEAPTNSTEKNTNMTPETTTTTETKKSSTSSETTSNNKKTTETKKSSNANLSNLGITPNDFKGFKAQTTTYNVTVPTDVESVTIYANAQDSKAKVSGVGKQNLQTGLNKFDVVVTAEDGTTKTYTLNITRDESSKNTENVQERYTGDGLASLNIENLELNPTFDTQKYEYSVKYIGEKENLNINATATDPYYIIEITGNEKLIEGENIVNILVSDPDGNNVATYQITVNKSVVDEEAIAKENQKRIIHIIAGIIACIIIVVIIIVLIKKKRKINNNWNDFEDENFEEVYNNKGNQLEDYDDNMNYKGKKSDFSKENARKKYLDNYENKSLNSSKDIDMEIEKKNRNKGKRYK